MPLGSYDLQQATSKDAEAAKLTLEVEIHNNIEKIKALEVMLRHLVNGRGTTINKLHHNYFQACKAELNTLAIKTQSTTEMSANSDTRHVNIIISSGLAFNENNFKYFGKDNPSQQVKMPDTISMQLTSNRYLDEIVTFRETIQKTLREVKLALAQQQMFLLNLPEWFQIYNQKVIQVRNILASLGTVDDSIAKYVPLITTTPYSYAGKSR